MPYKATRDGWSIIDDEIEGKGRDQAGIRLWRRLVCVPVICTLKGFSSFCTPLVRQVNQRVVHVSVIQYDGNLHPSNGL